MYQTKNRARQDPLNFPIKLTNKLAHLTSLMGNTDYAPTSQMVAVKEEMNAAIDVELAKYRRVLEVDVPKFNEMVREIGVGVIRVE